jgi:phospholipid/cholesterol/gamma-HCH transport system substrate-binding protein
MEERKRNFVVGLTTLGGVAGLIALLMLFGYVPAFLERGYEVRIELPRAAGLYRDSRVRYAGIDVGAVRAVRLQEPPKTGVIVTALIRPDVRIPERARFSVSQPLFGGGTAVDINIDDDLPEDPRYLPADDSAWVVGEIPDIATTFARELRSAIEQPVAQMERLTVQFEQLSDEWTIVGQNVNALIEARSPAAVDAGETPGNMATVLTRLDSRLAEMEQVLAGINRYVDDDELHADIRQTAASARELSGTAAASVEALRDRYIAVADDLSGAIASMQRTLELAGEPEGTLGKLLADPALYDNLNDAAERLQRTLDEAQLLVQKWRAEGLPVRVW